VKECDCKEYSVHTSEHAASESLNGTVDISMTSENVRQNAQASDM